MYQLTFPVHTKIGTPFKLLVSDKAVNFWINCIQHLLSLFIFFIHVFCRFCALYSKTASLSNCFGPAYAYELLVDKGSTCYGCHVKCFTYLCFESQRLVTGTVPGCC